MSSAVAPRTLLDATAIPQDRRGVGRYLDELVRAFDEPIIIACQAHDEEQFRMLAPTAVVLPQRGIARAWKRLLWEQFSLPRLARRVGATVIHSPHYTLPLFTKLTRVVTFHDATFFSDPHVHTPLKRAFFQTWIKVSARLADVIITVSQATANEIAKYADTKGLAKKFRVIHLGVNSEIFHTPSADEVREFSAAVGLDAPWIGFLGTVEPRKNLPELVRAYSELMNSWDAGWGKRPVLALAGGEGWGADLTPVIAASAYSDSIRRLGYIELSQMAAFLGGAQFAVYPSLGEGFGLPVLEAMASGAPMITTRRLALPEVGGDAVLYSEPDAASLTAALRELASQPEERARLTQLGLSRAALFTWAACARSHLAVYSEAAARAK